MGITFDPSMLMDILKKQGAGVTPPDELSGSNKFATGPSSNNQTPDAPQPQMPPPPQPQAAPQASPQPQQQRLNGIKGYLSNILHGVGEGMKAHLGMETDAQEQQRLYNQSLQTQKFDLERQNLQSEIMQRAAQVKQMQSMVTMPGGYQVPFALAKPMIEAQAKVQAAATGKRFMVVPNVGMMDTQAEGGPKLIPGSSPTGVQVTPEIAAQYNMPQQLVGKSIPLGQFAQMERGGAMWAPTVSNTVETKELSSGELVQIPKTSTSQKVGGVVPGAAPKAPVSLSTNGGVRTLVGKDGQPLRGKGSVQMMVGTDSEGKQVAGTPQELSAAGVSNFVKLGSAESDKVNTARQLTSPNGLFGLIDKDLAQFKPGELEALGPRWNEFLAGTIGTADRRYTALRTHVNGLLATALMQAHVGARGGEKIMEHFEDIANAGKMSLPTLKDALAAERQYVEEKAMRPTAKKNDPLGIL